MWTFSLRSTLLASAECLKELKVQKIKDFKKSKTKTSTTKTLKAKTPKYFSRESFFGLFRGSLSLERNCSMTACKNPENITGHVLSGFSQCSVSVQSVFSQCSVSVQSTFSREENSIILNKIYPFYRVPHCLPVQNVCRASKIQEMWDFES